MHNGLNLKLKFPSQNLQRDPKLITYLESAQKTESSSVFLKHFRQSFFLPKIRLGYPSGFSQKNETNQKATWTAVINFRACKMLSSIEKIACVSTKKQVINFIFD